MARALARLAGLFIYLAIAGQAIADEAAAGRLAQLLAGVDSFSADFVQTTLNANGRAVRTQRGSMHIARPNRFRWEVTTPLPLLVVSDGEDVYIYDKDLAQVTISDLDPGQIDTPAILLSGDTSLVSKSFAVVEEARGGDNHSAFGLTPLNPSSPYTSIRLTFRQKALVEIEMKDSFGQFSIVEIATRELNQPLDEAVFRFQIPDHVDVFRNDLP